MTRDQSVQIFLAVLSLAAVYMIAKPGPLFKWGFVVGLASQPFWLYATWRKRQWGMFIVSVAYIPGWTTGIHSYFSI